MAINEILPWLIERHWRELGIGREPAHAAADLSERWVDLDGRRVKLSARTLRNMLKGYVARPNKHTCRILAELFRPHIPAVEWRWFHTDADVFMRMALESSPAGRGNPLAAPEAGIQAGDEVLEGTYVAYRHAFSAITVNRIAREVLHIGRGGNGNLMFRMSYLPGTRGHSDVLMEFHGNAETAGRSIVLFGQTVGAGVEKRFRTFTACNNGHLEQPELRNFKLGLLISTTEGAGIPCAACTLLVKVQRRLAAEDLDAFMQAATRTDTFDKIIGRDFAAKDWILLRLFLDNRPSRSLKDLSDPTDAGLDAREGPGPRDPVLRISQDRFERSMDEVFQRALAATDIVPTFRQDWRPGAHDEPGANGEEGP